MFTGNEIAYGNSTITLAETEFGGFATASVTVSGATLRLGEDDAFAPLTDVIVSGGGQLDLNGHTTVADAVTLTDGTIVGGTLVGTAYTLQNGAISATLGGSGHTHQEHDWQGDSQRRQHVHWIDADL